MCHHPTRALLVFVALSVALVLAGCGDDDGATSDASDTPQSDGGEDSAQTDSTTTDTSATDTVGVDMAAGDTTRSDTAAGDTTASDTTDGVSPAGCEPPAPFDLDATYSAELHVATDGDDGSGDGSQGAPFATLGRAAQAASPGTRIVLAAGTYAGSTWIEGLQGTADAPIAIVGAGAVVLEAGGDNEVLHLVDPRYVVLENLTVTGALANGINIDDGGSYETPAEHVVLRGLTVHGVGTGGNHDCIKLSGLDRFHILDSELYDCNAGDAIDMVGCHDGVIAGNHLHDTPAGGIQAKGGSADTLITGNRFVDVGGRSINAGGSTGLPYFRPIDAPYEAARLRMIANVFVRPGVDGGASVAYVGCDACVFAHNTIYQPQTWIARILQETVDARFVPSRDGLFINNLVVFDVGDLRNGVFVNVGGNTAPETFTFGSNLWFALDAPGFSGPTLTDGLPAESGSVIQQDPLLVDPANGDLHVGAGSPAIGAARDTPGGVRGDFDGACYANPASIGAFAAP